MKITKKKSFVSAGLLVALLAMLFVASKVPIRTFSYYTTNGCVGNLLLYEGDIKYFKYRVIDGKSSEYERKKSELEALNVPQSEFCDNGFAPTDYTTIELFLF